MARPTANLLDLLELLQSRPSLTGREISEHLGVDPRTVRRYVASLQELGIPVEGARGAGGGYRLGRGYRLPPLMLDEREATAIVLGLAATRRLELGQPEPVDAALAKLRRVLPASLSRRVAALDAALAFTYTPSDPAAVAGERLLELADALDRRRRVALAYRSYSGEESEREVSPHGLVAHAGRWYLAAFDHGREDLRTFRVDRVGLVTLLPAAAHAAPPGFDAAAHVARSLARVPWRWEVEVLLHLPIDVARRRLPATLGDVSSEAEHTLLRMRADSLDWMASILAGLDCGFEIRRPEELRASVRALAERLTNSC